VNSDRRSDESYESILAGRVALPGRMECSLAEFARRITVTIDREMEKPLPDNALIALLCDAARLGWEQIEAYQRQLLKKASIEGRISYMHGAPDGERCKCCPPGTGHIFARGVEFEPFESAYPDHFGHGAEQFLGTVALEDNALEGKRVRLTVEVLDD